jgi:hypothetical protein
LQADVVIGIAGFAGNLREPVVGLQNANDVSIYLSDHPIGGSVSRVLNVINEDAQLDLLPRD